MECWVSSLISVSLGHIKSTYLLELLLELNVVWKMFLQMCRCLVRAFNTALITTGTTAPTVANLISDSLSEGQSIHS